MANSRKSKSSLVERIAAALRLLVPPDSLIVLGLSGGMDSVVLLHLLHSIAPRYQWRLSALHVHHGISPNADAWADFCSVLCAKYGIELHVERVDIKPLSAMGVEAAARQLRRAALDRLAVDFIALAHHRDDQVETLLLQLLRGAGVRGASAMPAHMPRANAPALLRPLLDVERVELQEYACQHELSWVEDESNTDEHYPRNFLRHRVLPVIEQRFPVYRATLARSASHFAEASELLDEIAHEDAHTAVSGDYLSLLALDKLSAARAKNLLRHFLVTRRAPLPDTSRLKEMLRQLREARQGAQIKITWEGWELRRYRDGVYVLPAPLQIPDFELHWHGEDVVELPAPCGILHFEPAVGAGLSLEKLRQSGVLIRRRRGGETIQTHSTGPHHTLKNIFQEYAIPPWTRNVTPLLFCGGELACVPGVTGSANFLAGQNEQGVLVSWQH